MRAMSAISGDLPVGPGWAYEMSWPGPLLFIDVTGRLVRVLNHAGRDVTRDWPELATMTADIDDALIEGHLLLVQPDAPIAFVCSDLLRLYGVDLTDRPYVERRGSLTRLAATHHLLTVSPQFDDARDTEAAAREHGLDGVVAKRLDSRYRAGVSPDWIRHTFTGKDESRE